MIGVDSAELAEGAHLLARGKGGWVRVVGGGEGRKRVEEQREERRARRVRRGGFRGT